MRTKIVLIAALAVASAAVSTAHARPRVQRLQKRFESNKTFGLGLELGSPVGINGKLFLGEGSDRAVDFGVGYIYDYFNFYGLHIYGDYLFHPVSLVSTEAFELPFYVGVGGRYWSFQDRGVAPYIDASALGFRVPLGLSFDLNAVPLDIFVQVVPTIDLFFNYRPHNLYIDLDASVGFRYWFN